MNTFQINVSVLLSLLLPALLPAQIMDGMIARVHTFSAHPGHRDSLENGLQQHLSWHREHNDPWLWHGGQVLSGVQTGDYVIGTYYHQWQEFGNPPFDQRLHDQNLHELVLRHCTRHRTDYLAAMPVLSHSAGKHHEFSELHLFELNPGMETGFVEAVAAMQKGAAGQPEGPHFTWYKRLTGEDLPAYILLIPRYVWGDFAPQHEVSVSDLLAANGEGEAEIVLQQFSQAIARQSTLITHNRIDLSYIPQR